MKTRYNRGFSLAELLVSVFIISLVIITVGTFQRDIFTLNFNIQDDLNAAIDARHVIKIIAAELRTSSPSATGGYSIALASSTGITFYSDIDGNGLTDQVRYFLSGTTLKRGVTAPSGSPLTYNNSNEVVTTLASSVVASSTLPLFQYYTASYAGTSTPLSVPIDIPSIRLIKVTVIIDKSSGRSPAPLIVTTQVSLRNLKDNL